MSPDWMSQSLGIWIQIGEFTYEAEYLESDDASYNQIVAESGGVLKVSGSGVGILPQLFPLVLYPTQFSCSFRKVDPRKKKFYYDRNCLCLPLCF